MLRKRGILASLFILCHWGARAMFNLRHLLNAPLGFYTYIWQDVFLIKETPKAVLIIVGNQKAWLPKAWILRIKRNKNDRTIAIKISLYHWAKKFS